MATMTPEDVSATSNINKAAIVPISGKNKDGELICLRECLTLILLGTLYNTTNGYHNFWGILSFNAA